MNHCFGIGYVVETVGGTGNLTVTGYARRRVEGEQVWFVCFKKADGTKFHDIRCEDLETLV